MKILLIDLTDTWLSDTRGPSASAYINPMADQPIGLMYLSAFLKAKLPGKVDIRIISTAIDCRSWEELQQMIAGYQPNLVGIRAITMQNTGAAQVSQLVKEIDRNCLVLLGGPYPTSDPQTALAIKDVDLIIIGEGETTLLEIVSALIEKQPLKAIKGIGYKDESGQIHLNPSRPLIENLDSLPFPDYSQISFDAYAKSKNSSLKHVRHASLLTSRGCPFHCIYCHSIFRKKQRVRSPANVLAEINYLYNQYGIDHFQIIDDIFNLDIERAHLIFDLIIKSGLKLTFAFSSGLRGDLLDKELIDKLVEGGGRFLFFAVETASPRLQKLIKKNLNLDKLMTNLNYASTKNCVTGGSFMLGFPSETEDEIRQTIEYAKLTDLTFGYFFVVTCFPGTEIWEIAKAHNLNPEDYRYNFHKLKKVMANCSTEVFRELYLKARREFYFSAKRINATLAKFPIFYTAKEMADIFIAQIIGGQANLADITDLDCRQKMAQYFKYAETARKFGVEFSF